MPHAASLPAFFSPRVEDLSRGERTPLLRRQPAHSEGRASSADFSIGAAVRSYLRSYWVYPYVGFFVAIAFHLFHLLLFAALMMSPLTARSFVFSGGDDTPGLLTARDEDGTRAVSVWTEGVFRLSGVGVRRGSIWPPNSENTTDIFTRNTAGSFLQSWEASPLLVLVCYALYMTASLFLFAFLTRGRFTGHFSLLQLVLGGVELVWYLRHGTSSFTVFLWLFEVSPTLPHPWVPFAKQHPGGGVTFHAYSRNRTGLWQMELAPEEYILPFTSTLEVFVPYTTAAFFTILIVCFALNLQRALDAVVGVRELAVADGHRRCPLCGEEWELRAESKHNDDGDERFDATTSAPSGAAMSSLVSPHPSGRHRCPKLFLDGHASASGLETLSVDDSISSSYHLRMGNDITNDDGELQAVHLSGATLPKVSEGREVRCASGENCGIAHPPSYGTLDAVVPVKGRTPCDLSTNGKGKTRPGNAFPSLEQVGCVARATYSWLNPLMSFGLIDSGLLHHERFLPSLPSEFTSRQNIAVPAWQLWANRRRWFGAARYLEGDVGMEGADDVGGAHTDDGEDSSDDGSCMTTNQESLLRGANSPLKRPKVSLLESLVRLFTVPIRCVLYKALVCIFIGEGSGGVQLAEERSGGNDSRSAFCTVSDTAKLAPPDVGLFRLFLEHRSGRRFVFLCVPLRLVSDALSLATPAIVCRLILAIEGETSKGMDIAIGVCGVLFLVLLGRALLHQEYMSQMYLSALEAGTAIKALVLEKTLALPLAQRTFTDGEVIHLVTVDASRCGQTLMQLHQSWRCPCFAVASLYVLHMHIGAIPTLAGLFIILLAVPFQWAAGKEVQAAQQRCKTRSVDCIELVEEAMTSMRQVKAMGAEEMYLRRMHLARQEETRGERGAMEAQTNSACLMEGMGVLLTSACYTVYYLSGGPLTARVVVPALVALNLLRGAISEWPALVAAIPRGYASLCRIEAYLRQAPDKFSSTCVDMTAAGYCKKRGTVVCNGCSFTWQSDNSREAPRLVLRDVRMRINPGELVVVQGPLGSGKSTLLLAILGEVNRCGTTAMPPAAAGGSDASSPLELRHPKECIATGFAVFGRSVYCSETPWLQNDTTIRANIVLDNAYDRHWYQTVTQACALHEDFKGLPKGDISVVGAEDVQLSSGQQARVALARALYSRADVYVLDNVLVSLDSCLRAHVIEHVFHGILRNRTVVLATHVGLSMLKPNRLFLLRADGTVVEEKTQQLSSLYTDDWEEPTMGKKMGMDDNGTGRSGDGSGDGIKGPDTAHGLKCGPLGQSSAYFRRFLTIMGPSLFWVVLISVAQHVLQVGRDVWLSLWIAKKPIGSVGFLLCYFMIGAAAALCIIPRMRVFFHVMRKSINHVHFAAFDSMLRAPVSYADANAGDIITGTFSRDQETADHSLVRSLDGVATGVLQTLAIVFFNAVVNPWFLFIVPLTAMLFYHVIELYLILTAQVRRLESRSVRGPVLILRELLGGAAVVRCAGLKDVVRGEYYRALDATNTGSMVGHMADCWMSLRLEIITVLMTTTAAVLGVLSAPFSMPPAFAAVAVVCCLQTSNTLLLLCRNVSAFQLQFVSVEQLFKLQQVPVEPLTTSSTDPKGSSPTTGPGPVSDSFSSLHESHKLLATAPQGMVTISESDDALVRLPVIELVNVSAKYSGSLPYALRNVSLSIYEKERVGIVGPSGSGKSTLFNVLLRFVDIIEGGGVFVRGADAGLLPRSALRRLFTLVLQDPLVMRGTWRANLLVGREEHVADEALWAALRAVGLEAFAARHGGLDGRLQNARADGVRLSPGQRQLLWLARAVLWRPPFFLLDELPDSGAAETRGAIQRVLAGELRDCTALLIAHSVRTLEALCTRVVVLDSGAVSQVFTMQESRGAKAAIKNKLQSIVE